MEIKTRPKRARRNHPFRLALQSSMESPTPILLLPTTTPPIQNPVIRRTRANQVARSKARESRNTFPRIEWFYLRHSLRPTLRSKKPTCLLFPSRLRTRFPFCPPIRTQIKTQIKTQTQKQTLLLLPTLLPNSLPSSPFSIQ